ATRPTTAHPELKGRGRQTPAGSGQGGNERLSDRSGRKSFMFVRVWYQIRKEPEPSAQQSQGKIYTTLLLRTKHTLGASRLHTSFACGRLPLTRTRGKRRLSATVATEGSGSG
ncbi:unnamed protein product, partial [Ectocarpus sp. 12 AP-2014]